MNEAKVTRLRRCPRCQQVLTATVYGMWQHALTCLTFGHQQFIIRKLHEEVRYVPQAESAAPEVRAPRVVGQRSARYHGRGPGAVRRHGHRNAFRRQAAV